MLESEANLRASAKDNKIVVSLVILLNKLDITNRTNGNYLLLAAIKFSSSDFEKCTYINIWLYLAIWQPCLRAFPSGNHASQFHYAFSLHLFNWQVPIDNMSFNISFNLK